MTQPMREPAPTNTITADLITAIEGVVGPKGYLREHNDIVPYVTDRRSAVQYSTPIVVRPENTDQVSQVLGICNAAGVGVVPQGGNTGLVQGSVPESDGTQIVLSLSRMNRVREVDELNATLTVEAGVILADVQTAAAEADLLFPLSLGAEGSCQIGGNLATNAGGNTVVRYGNARDLVLGLEVVLADGQVWNGLRGLRKDNTGYDLKHLFVGSEGTLGIITAVVLKLYPRPQQLVSALVAVPSARDATRLLSRCQHICGENISSFEYIHRNCLDLVLEHVPGTRDPLEHSYGHYVLLELGSSKPGDDLQQALEGVLEQGLETGEVENATITTTLEQSNALWRLREEIPEATRLNGSRIGHDVSVPVSRVADFLEQGAQIVAKLNPGARLIPFGHMGDGNIHFNMTAAEGVDKSTFMAPAADIEHAIYELVYTMGGSFSAEHGIGALKKDELATYRSKVELGLMQSLKAALDTKGILNPGKVV